MNKFKYIGLLGLVLFYSSCMSQPINEGASPNSSVFQKDAKIIIYGLQNQAKHLNFNDHDQHQVYRIYYSADSLKMFALVGNRNKRSYDSIETDQRTYGFEGYGVIGYRIDKEDMWWLYNFSKYKIYDAENHVGVRDDLDKYFLKGGLAKDSHYVLTPKGSVSYAYGGNLGDQTFWDCLLWKPSEYEPELFNFQVNFKSIWDWDENGKPFIAKKWSERRPFLIPTEYPK